MLAAIPGSLILWLLLTPDHLGQLVEGGQHGGQLLVREWVKLFDAHQGYVSQLVFAPRLQQIVIDLARTEHDPGNGLGLMLILLADDILKTPLSQLIEG